MGKLITLLFLALTFHAYAQEPVPNQTFRERYYKFSKYMAADSGLILPQRNTSWTPFRPALTFNPSDNQLYLFNGTSWNAVSGGGGGSQTLQQVTDLGNVSSNALIVTGQASSSLPDGGALFYDSGIGAVYLANIQGGAYVSGMGFNQDKVDISIGDPSGSGTGLTIQEQTSMLAGISTPLRMSGAEAINPNEFVTLSQIGSGGSQNLQQVTDVGASTTDQITTGGLVSNGNVDVTGSVLTDDAEIAGSLVVSGTGQFDNPVTAAPAVSGNQLTTFSQLNGYGLYWNTSTNKLQLGEYSSGAVTVPMPPLGGIRLGNNDSSSGYLTILDEEATLSSGQDPIDASFSSIVLRRASGVQSMLLDVSAGGGDINRLTMTETESTFSKSLKIGGELEFIQSSNGVILKSPNGTRWKVTIDDTGNLEITAL